MTDTIYGASPAMIRYMANIEAGRPPHYGLHTASQWGGLMNTMSALQRRGWIEGGHGGERLTEAGKVALATARGNPDRITLGRSRLAISAKMSVPSPKREVTSHD